MIDSPPPGRPPARRFDPAAAPPSPAERAALWLQFGVALALEAAFLVAGWTLYKYLPDLAIEPWQKVAFQVGLGLAFAAFGLRALGIWRRLHAAAPPAA
jgi:hypothetical protein